MPYVLPQDYERFDRVIDAVNADEPEFTVHVGDTKSGGSPCSDESFDRTWSSFGRFDHPLIYTPGDNEWTDCHREAAGRMDPIERLAAIRERFFPDSMTLGGGAAFELETQSADPQWERFVENRMWMRSRVLFATLHIVGSKNNRQESIPGAVAEFLDRDAANEAWLTRVFDRADATGAPAVALFIHANPFGNGGEANWDDGFTRFLNQLRARAIAFAKPVLITHGDSHYFRIDKPLMHADSDHDVVGNVTRLEVFGSSNMHAVRVTVDPDAPGVFSFSELIVEANRR